MRTLVLQVIAMDDAISMSDTNAPSVTGAQNMIKEQTQSLLTLFFEKEKFLSKTGGTEGKVLSWEASQLTRVTKLLLELINEFDSLPENKLLELSWLSPMLSSCMDSSNETIRVTVHRLQKKMLKNINGGDQVKNGA